jgi:hypothetical protein
MTSKFKPSKFPEPLALNYFSEDDYTKYCMHPDVREKIIKEEKAFFHGNENILSEDYRDHANMIIERLKNRESVENTTLLNELNAYHTFMVKKYNIAQKQKSTPPEITELATSSEPRILTKRKNPTIDEDIKTAFEIIEPLKGYWNRKRILNDTDFDRLKIYIESIIRNDSLPEPVKTFPRTGTTNDFIRKTIYEVYRMTGKRNRQLFIDLIHLFRQFDKTELTTTYRKFSNYQGNYIKDKETMIAY